MKKNVLKNLVILFLGISFAFTTKTEHHEHTIDCNFESVSATFTMGRSTYKGIQPTQRKNRVHNAISGLSGVNNDEYGMHAEIEAMQKARKAGKSGGNGTLRVSGQAVCRYCKGDVKKMASYLDLDKLTVIESDGDTFVFNGSKDFLPVNKGGKGWVEQTR